jgi:hypothetical protein
MATTTHDRSAPSTFVGTGGVPRAARAARRPGEHPVAGRLPDVFGALLVWDTWRFVAADRIWRYYVAPEFTFTYPGFGWVQPLPEPWIHVAWGLVGVTAFLVMVGLFYRVAIVAFTLSSPTSSCSTRRSTSTTSTWSSCSRCCCACCRRTGPSRSTR